MKETADERFKRIATLRTNAILDKIKVLGKLSNRQRYNYSDKDINKMFSAINRQLKEAKAKFEFDKERKFRL
ncbi:MAG: hypothetical protein A2Z28_01785 [Chloroflexi bacterium RBG_16_51_9]|nr:MAG: hypothetical protein A2Z28_01785 [Chloroflexi bacterium RBG_16_51_9]